MIQDWTYTGGILYLDLLSTAYTHNMSVIAGNITPQTVVVYQTAGQNFTALPVLAVSAAKNCWCMAGTPTYLKYRWYPQ